jgi:hypothetical protein
MMSGFVLFFLAGIVAPSLYQEPVIEQRVETISLNQSQWIFSQILFALGGLLPAIGFLLLAIHLQDKQNAWLINLGTAAILLETVFGVIFVYYQTLDPAKYWEMARPSPLLIVYIFLILTGAFLYGLVFLQGAFPNWLGYVTIGFTILVALGILVLRVPVFFAASLFYFVALIMGIVVLRG